MTKNQYKEGLVLMGTINGIISEAEHDVLMAAGAEGMDVCNSTQTGRIAALRAIRDYICELLNEYEPLQEGPHAVPLISLKKSDSPEEV